MEDIVYQASLQDVIYQQLKLKPRNPDAEELQELNNKSEQYKEAESQLLKIVKIGYMVLGKRPYRST